ncbi:MAG: GntR family transcriptional regulator [Actinobacteria bacterium]|nr:GntR family transcriptional regulator [Actinomycetota bacterium]
MAGAATRRTDSRQTPKHRTLAERAVAELQEAILNGELAPGQPLHLERLARQLEMSPMPVREAVRQLERLGLAEHVPHRGARVSQLSVEDLRQTYQARLLLETLAVREAAERFGDEEASLATQRLAEHVAASRAGDLRGGRLAHAEFHLGLYEASGSHWLPRLIRPLWQNSERYRIASLAGRGSIERRRREHQRILDACIRRDPDGAEAALRAHLVLTANLVARRMGVDDLFDAS